MNYFGFFARYYISIVILSLIWYIRWHNSTYSVKVKVSDSQFDKFKSALENAAGATLRVSISTNVLKWWIERQVAKLHQVFTNRSSANIKFSKIKT